MQTDIKCANCGKMTRHFELGEIYYDVEKPSSTVVVKNGIICPKCKTDISDKKCMVKINYFLMSLVAANISLGMGELDFPPHLRGAFPLRKQQHSIIAPHYKAQLQLVKKFLRWKRKNCRKGALK